VADIDRPQASRKSYLDSRDLHNYRRGHGPSFLLGAKKFSERSLSTTLEKPKKRLEISNLTRSLKPLWEKGFNRLIKSFVSKSILSVEKRSWQFALEGLDCFQFGEVRS
jgi:hypothetical protein